MPYIEKLTELLQDNSNANDAVLMKKYMKNKFEFYGIKSNPRRKLSKQVYKDLGKPKPETLPELVTKLFELPQREYHYFGMEIFNLYKKTEIREDFIEMYEYMITHKSWWDIVDMIAAKFVGQYLMLYPQHTKSYNSKWMKSSNMWLNRTAILFQLKYKTDTDQNMLFANCKFLSNSNEFFIRKAIGWSLREYSKTNQEAVINFVQNNQLSSLSKKEALRLIK